MKTAIRFVLIGTIAVSARAGILFQDAFNTPGTKLDLASWTTEIGPTSFLGRTQLADWVTPGGVGQFVVGANGAQLTLNTFNPTGNPAIPTLYGTHGKTLKSFQPSANTVIEFTSRLRLTSNASKQKGLVYAMYFYGCSTDCANHHDEIDIEVLTNALQPGSTLQVQVNRYANEPGGAGNGSLVNLPAGFDPLTAHDWTIRWSLARIDYLVDGVLLSSAYDHVPQGPMEVNVEAWGPDYFGDHAWPAAYDGSLQAVSSAAQNQAFTAFLSSVIVNETTATELCASAVSPASLVALPSGGTLTVNIIGSPCFWSASSIVPWLTFANGSSGSGSALNVTVAANMTGAQRTGTLTVAGQTVTVTQGANNPLQIPALVSLNPFQGTGPNATLTLVYAHPSGWAAIQSVEFIINPRW